MRSLQITLLLFAISIGINAQNDSPLEREIQFHQLAGKSFKASRAFKWAGPAEPRMRSAVAGGYLLQLDLPALRESYHADEAAISMQIPTGEDSSLKLKLIRQNLLTDDFSLTTSSGQPLAIDYRPGRYYRGVVEGSARSAAAISIFEDKVIGVIETAEAGNMILGALADDARGRYILFRANDLADIPPFECGTQELGDPTNSLRTLSEHLQSGAFTRGPGNCVRAYLECEHDMFREKGSVQNTADFITGLFNVVATIYQNEMVTTVISGIFVWDTPDAYPTGSTLDALQAFRNYRTSFNGDVAHLVSRGAPGGGGIAWIDALCSPYNYAYSYISSGYSQFPTYSWSANVIAHEMGHNLGCWHTHDCSWDVNGDGIAGEAFDGCGDAAGFAGYGNCPIASLPFNGGTVMSYCHLVNEIGINLSNGFGTLPGDKIRFEVGNASCLSGCSTCSHTVSIAKTDVRCNSAADGTASATATGGLAPYSFRWSTGATTSAITSLNVGPYTVSVTDGSGCTVTGTVSIIQPSALTLNTTAVSEAVYGANNGFIDLAVNGGTAPYAYRWSTGSTAQDLYGLGPGTYSVTVTDGNGCAKSSSATLNSNGCASQHSSFPYIESFESGSGSWVQSSADAFNWTRYSGSTPTGQTGPSSAQEGNYYMYIEASSQASGSAILQSPCLNIVNMLNPRVSFHYHMFGINTGSLSFQVSMNNGASWITLWTRSGSQSDAWQPATVALAGFLSQYTRLRFVGTVTNGGDRGDMAIDAIRVDGDPVPCDAPVLVTTSTAARCYGGSDGTAMVSASQGVSPYTYMWPNGSATAAITGLSASSYEVTVTGSNSCFSTAVATVSEASQIILSFNVTNESAIGANDGTISLIASGGSPPYNYAWSNGAGTASIGGLSSGAYSVTVTDAHGCTRAGSATVSRPSLCNPLAGLPYFESFETGFGQWVQNANDGFDWSRGYGNTPTNNTGPANASDGTYYIFTRSNRSNNNSTTYLESPCFGISGMASPAFSFDYHMNGNQMGALGLEISTDAGNSWSVIWSQSDNQGINWRTAAVSLSNFLGKDIKLRFAGTMGGRQSEMAVDHIRLIDQAGRMPAPIQVAVPHLQASLYPNPARDRMALVIESAGEGEAQLSLISQPGQAQPWGVVNLAQGRNEFNLPVHKLKQGLYYLCIQTEEGRLVERFIIH